METYSLTNELQRCRVGILGLGVLGTPVGQDLAKVGLTVQGWANAHKELQNT